MYDHSFCPIHRIAYNALLDPTCPQCTLAGIMPPEQLEFDAKEQKPVNAAGERLDARTLKVVE